MLSRHVVIIAMTIATVEFATLTQVACLRRLVWVLAILAATQNGVAKRHHPHHRHHQFHHHPHQQLGQLQQTVCNAMGKMWSCTGLAQLALSTCCVASA